MSDRRAVAACDVVVVGGGLCGIIAARELRHAGLGVIVVEARERLGGRIWTTGVFEDIRDVGATFVHWTQPHIWAEVTRYGLALSQRPPLVSTVWSAEGERIHGDPSAFHALVATAMDAYCEAARTVFPRPYEAWRADVEDIDHASMAEPIADLPVADHVKAAVHAFWSVNCNRDCSEGALSHALHLCALTGGDWRLFNEACARYKLAGGMEALVKAVECAAYPEVQLQAPVSQIEQSNTGVAVTTTSGGAVRAMFAIVALPLNALDSIEFIPPLSVEKQAAMREGAPAGGFKLWLKLRGSVESCLCMAPADRPLMFARYEGEASSGSVFTCYGAERDALGADPFDALQDAIDGWLPGARVDEWWMYDWVDDAFARETWRVPRPGQSSRLADELERPERRVLLAGADYARGWCGFMDGAVESGLRVSRSVIDLLTSRTGEKSIAVVGEPVDQPA
jgi:monoamine oxidase